MVDRPIKFERLSPSTLHKRLLITQNQLEGRTPYIRTDSGTLDLVGRFVRYANLYYSGMWPNNNWQPRLVKLYESAATGNEEGLVDFCRQFADVYDHLDVPLTNLSEKWKNHAEAITRTIARQRVKRKAHSGEN